MKKNVKTVTCAALSLMMANTCMTTLYAKDGDDTQTTKDETVYAMLHPDGSVDEEIVSSWLHNDHGIKNIKESLNLKDVKNVKSDDQPSVKGNTYTWNVDGNDVYYEGKTTKQLPVKVNVTYKLNGQAIDGKDLIGKSGPLEIHITMKNTQTRQVNINGKTTNIHPLYIGAGVIDLSTDHFSNVTCENGKILNEGNNQMVGIVALPGLEDTLKSSGINDTKGLKIQDEYVIKCETKDFEMGPIMIALTPEVPLDKLKDINSLDELLDGIDQLSEASVKLANGTSQLAEGTATLNSKVKEMVNSIPALSTGVNDLKSGTTKLTKGSKELSANLKNLSNGLSLAKDGTKKLTTATKDLPTLVTSISELNDGMQTLSTGLREGNTKIQSVDLKKMQTLVDDLAAYPTQLTELANSALKLNTAIQGINTIVNDDTLKAASAQATAKTTAAKTTACTLYAQNADPTKSNMTQEQINALKAICTDTTYAEGYASGVQNALYGDADGAGHNVSNLSAAAALGSAKLSEKAPELNAAATQLNGAVSLVKTTLTDLGTLQDSMKDAAEGAATLAAGTSQLKTATANLGELKTGIKTLNTNMVSASSGASQLYNGSKTLVNGLTTANAGVTKLQNGSTALSKGAKQLHAATTTLAEKTGELNKGMQTFKMDGIDKMKHEVNVSMSDLNQLLSIKNEIVKEAENEHTFAGAPTKSTAKVKFIYKTEELKHEKKVETEKKATKEESKDNFFDKITNFFAKLL